MYYDPSKTLSKQRLFNFVIGPRGAGKTYGAKTMAIKKFLKTGKQFVYLRRYETEMPASLIANFFNDISDGFPGTEFKAYNGKFLINKRIAGWYFPLSKATMLKSIPFNDVWLIIFDEFIIEVGMYRYLPNEVKSFLECYSTISRDRDIPVLFLSNAITMTNPYFLYFNITMEQNQTTKLTQFISVELIQNQEYIDHVKSTRFGQLIAETEYGKYNIENKFILDTETFISPMPTACKYIATFILQNREYGFYVDTENTLWYFSPAIDKTCPNRIALEFSEHDQNSILMQRTNPYIRIMLDCYCQGNIRFTNQETKNILTPILRRLI